ncbi:MAG: hypothetical protein ABI237_14825 [Ginsengibacter sp.]
MFSSISWQEYFWFLLMVVLSYYLFVWVIYFKAKRPSLIHNGEVAESFENVGELSNDVPSNSQRIIEEIMPVFVGRQNRNELFYALHIILEKYNQWDEPGFREEVNAFIRNESKIKCSIHLNEEDLDTVWM